MTYREYLEKGGNTGIYRVAAESGVSPPTIRRAMDGEPVAFASAEKILRAIHALEPRVKVDDTSIIRMCGGSEKAGGSA
jgi:hypothetical protein